MKNALASNPLEDPQELLSNEDFRSPSRLVWDMVNHLPTSILLREVERRGFEIGKKSNPLSDSALLQEILLREIGILIEITDEIKLPDFVPDYPYAGLLLLKINKEKRNER